jgi:hypothetical protein
MVWNLFNPSLIHEAIFYAETAAELGRLAALIEAGLEDGETRIIWYNRGYGRYSYAQCLGERLIRIGQLRNMGVVPYVQI